MKLVCIAYGVNEKKEPYSKLVPIVELPNGNSYLNMKALQYVQKQYPLLKQFSNEIKEV